MPDYQLHHEDLPAKLKLKGDIAVDTETMGLSPQRDRLCLVQLADAEGAVHLVKFGKDSRYNAPNLCALLSDPKRQKIMHYGRFDIAIIYQVLKVMCEPVFCTKIASRLARTYTDKHGLANLCRDILGEELDKQQQTSDWGSDTLDAKQLTYACGDVIYLHRLRNQLILLLKREDRYEIAQNCFAFLPTRARLDLLGWAESDVFNHS